MYSLFFAETYCADRSVSEIGSCNWFLLSGIYLLGFLSFHLYKNPDNLFVWISTLQELDQNIENLQNDKKQLNSQLEGKSAEISTLTGRIKEQEKNLGEKFMEIVRLQSVVDDLKDQLEDVLISYQNDRDWWKHRADKVLG